MKKFFVLYLLMTFGINSFAQDTRPVSLNEAIRSAMQYLTGRIAPNSKVVVLNFSAPTEELSNYIVEDLIDYIVNSQTLTVVDRRSLEVLRQELNFQMSGEVSEETAQSIGKILGAQSIISGSISPLGRNYRFRVQAVEVETAAFQGGQTVTVMEDETLAALLGNNYISPRSTSRFTAWKFAIGGQAGTFAGLFTESEWDGMGEYVILGFIGSLYGAYAFNSVFRLQFGVSFAMNSLLEYTSIDIPIFPYLYFNPSSNALLRIGVGPYLSLPLGNLNSNGNYHIDATVNFGLLGGLGAGYRIGNGNIVFDVRYFMDFTPIKYAYIDAHHRELNRKGITGLLGYEYWF